MTIGNRKLTIEQGELKVLYYRFKKYLIPLGVILGCILLVFFVLVPQAQNLLSLRGQENEAQQRIDILKKNVTLLNSLSDSQLDEKIKIVSAGLPIEKNYAGVLDALSIAEKTSQVTLGDFEFDVGDLSTGSARTFEKEPRLFIELFVNGPVAGMKDFLDKLSESLPISEVSSIQMNNKISTVKISFFYRPLPPIKFDVQKPLNGLKSSHEEIITMLQKWQSQQYTPSPAALLSPTPAPSPSTVQGATGSAVLGE